MICTRWLQNQQIELGLINFYNFNQKVCDFNRFLKYSILYFSTVWYKSINSDLDWSICKKIYYED